jgi:hypothetical protein
VWNRGKAGDHFKRLPIVTDSERDCFVSLSDMLCGGMLLVRHVDRSGESMKKIGSAAILHEILI